MSGDHGTRTDGTVITDEVVEELATEAETGYDVGALVARKRQAGRPTIGSGAASVESVRLDPDLKRELLLRAAVENTSVSELIRTAVRQYLSAS